MLGEFWASFFWLFRYAVLASGFLLGASFVLANTKYRFAINTQKWIRYSVFVLLAVVLFIEPALRSWLQYQAFLADPAARYLLPPHQPWNYFAGYTFIHFWLWRLLGLFVAGAIFVLVEFAVVRPSEGFRMNREEAFLIAFGIAFAGWPYLLVYLVAFLLFYTLILAVFELRFRIGSFSHSSRFVEGASPPRFPVALPATLALLAIPFANWFIVSAGLGVLRVTNLSV